MNKKLSKLTGAALFSALVIILQLIANYISFGGINITLSLIPIVIGAIIYGPLIGFILGLINGVIVILSPSTVASFLSQLPLETIIVCLLKTSIAGLISGLIFKALKNKNFTLSIILASIAVPLINTSLFALSMLTLLRPLLDTWAQGQNIFGFLFISLIGINFIIEFIINSALTPTIITLIKLNKHIK